MYHTLNRREVIMVQNRTPICPKANWRGRRIVKGRSDIGEWVLGVRSLIRRSRVPRSWAPYNLVSFNRNSCRIIILTKSSLTWSNFKCLLFIWKIQIFVSTSSYDFFRHVYNTFLWSSQRQFANTIKPTLKVWFCLSAIEHTTIIVRMENYNYISYQFNNQTARKLLEIENYIAC